MKGLRILDLKIEFIMIYEGVEVQPNDIIFIKNNEHCLVHRA